MEWTFLKKLISKLSQDVFRPAQTGLLYQTLQTISREISGECPWDSGSECQKNYSTFYRGPKCRNITCPGYLHPIGLIAYTSRSSLVGYGPASSMDNRFDFSSFKFRTIDDFMPVGTFGAEIKFDFGTAADSGGYGVGFYGANLYGGNSIPLSSFHTVIGDKWKVDCTAETGLVGPAIPISVSGVYGPIVTRGNYFGKFDTYYIIEIIDFWGWQQNFSDALFQISLATATDEWVDYWGTYFGIPRLLLKGGYEEDSTYKARIMKEITRAKGTKPVLEEEARAYFGREDISIIEYHQTYIPPSLIGRDGPVPLSPPNTTWPAANLRGANQPYPWPDPDPAWGLQPYQFYIFPPTQKVPSSKWIKTKDNLIEPEQWTGDLLPTGSGNPKVYAQEGASGYYGYGSGAFTPTPLPNVTMIDSLRNWLFIPPAQVGDAILFGCIKRFSGLRIVFSMPITYDDADHPYDPFHVPPIVPPVDGYLYDELPVPEVYNQLDGTGTGVGGEYIWEYWNGTGWSLLTVTDSTVLGGPAIGSTIVGGFTQDGWVNWKLPGSDISPRNYKLWEKTNDIPMQIPNVPDGEERYWIRCRISVIPTAMPDCNYVGFVYAGSTNRGCYNGTGVKGTLPLIPADVASAITYVTDKQPAADPPLPYSLVTLYKGNAMAIVPPYGKRDANNIYVYSSDAWAKPEWESGLQGIIDRLKTAGTVCIINPPT